MDFEFEKKWREVLVKVSETYGEELDLQGIIFLVGVQELGHGYRKFNKTQKLDVMHVALCTLLQPYGYYKFVSRDQDDWPHFEKQKNLPSLDSKQQDRLIREAILEYFGY